MPEGDTLHRVAGRLRPVLVDAELRGFRALRPVGPRPRPGRPIRSVEAVGKHLLVTFGDEVVLQTHLGMTGAWHVYRTGEPWRKPSHLARVVIEVDGFVAVCFSAPTVRTHLAGQIDRAVGHLGPDLCTEGADLDLAVERLGTVPDADTRVADALLNQRVVSGIGNVYKSEVLWACRVDPAARVADLDLSARRRLVETAARLLRANVDTPRRTTVPGGLAVYGRARRPCPRCGTPVRVARQGPHARPTYWCPRCQPPSGGRSD